MSDMKLDSNESYEQAFKRKCKQTNELLRERLNLQAQLKKANEDLNLSQQAEQEANDYAKKANEQIEGYSDKGFWGRTAARLQDKNNKLEQQLKEARELLTHYVTDGYECINCMDGDDGCQCVEVKQFLEKYKEGE